MMGEDISEAQPFTHNRLLFVVNEAHFFVSHRLPIALAAKAAGFDVHLAAPATHVWAPQGFDVEEIRELGIHFHVIPLSRRGRNLWQEFSTFMALVRLYRRLRPDLVHLLTIKPVLYGGFAARLCGVPAMTATITGMGHLFSSQKFTDRAARFIAEPVYRMALQHPNAIVFFQNEENRTYFTQRGMIPISRTVLTSGSGVDLKQFAPAPASLGNPEDDTEALQILLPARMIWEKGIDVFHAAALRLRKQAAAGACPPVRFILAGGTHSSNPRAVPESVLRDWHRRGDVTWLGRVEDMPALLQQVDIVCLPSAYGEGIPKALIEAAAMALPIVTTDIPGCRQIVQHGVNGLLIPPNDVAALEQALTQLIKYPELRRRLGAAGRRAAEAEYSVESVIATTLNHYKQLLGTRPARQPANRQPAKL